jgi:Ca2+-binding EF-hand superfamily protein
MKSLVGNTIFLLLLASPVAQAEDAALPPAYGPIPFSTYDTNRDGSVSEQEFNAVRSQRLLQKAEEGRPMRGAATAPGFADLDSNKDGKLSPAELAQGQQQRTQNRPGPGGGKGSGAGMGPGRANRPVFADWDHNGDGVVDEQEFNTARGKRMTDRAQQGYQMRGAANAPAFADIDTNHDGRISPDEFAEHQSARQPGPAAR